MKRLIYILVGFLLAIVTACSENQEPWSVPEACGKLNELIQNNCLLEQVVSSNDTYTFQFGNTSVTMDAGDVLSVDVNREQWKTVLTLVNNSTIEIPTLGTSLAAFVDNVKVNPSGYNPLAATIRLNLPCNGAIRVGIVPKAGSITPKQENTYAYSQLSTRFVDVLGLYADYINDVELTLLDEAGKELVTSTIQIETDALEHRQLPDIRITKALVDKMEPGLTLISSPGQDENDTSIPYMVDADGEIRWILDWRTSPDMQYTGAQCGVHRLANGNYVLADWNRNQVVEVDVFGAILHRWDLKAMGYTFHHEITQSANGDFLIAVSRDDAVKIDGKTRRILDFVIELSPESGQVVKEWDFGGMLDQDRLCFLDDNQASGGQGAQSSSNWLHNNGIAYCGEDALVATARWQGAFKFDRKGKVHWILAPHKDWGMAWRKFLLQPLDKTGQPITDPDVINGLKPHPDFEWAWGLHCPVVLPNGHILVFDNGYCRNFIPCLSSDESAYSRVVEYEVDEENMTVRQVWQYGRERGRDCYAAAVSGVQYLPKTDHRLFCPGMINRFSDGRTGGRVVEIDPHTGEVLFEMELPVSCMMAFHRATRISLYPEKI
ncbi:aryl-sulfate sulfotransferase [Phocaeicola sp.]